VRGAINTRFGTSIAPSFRGLKSAFIASSLFVANKEFENNKRVGSGGQWKCINENGRSYDRPFSRRISLLADPEFDSLNCRVVATLDIFLADAFGLCESRESDYRENEKELVDCVHVIFHLLRELS